MLKTVEILGVAFFALAGGGQEAGGEAVGHGAVGRGSEATTTGGIEAERKGMDLVGIYVIAFVTALGGGIPRTP
jgi:uncharacterized membrane protein YeiH